MSTSGLTVVFHYLKSMADLDTNKIPPNSAPKSEVTNLAPQFQFHGTPTVGGIWFMVFSVTYYWGVMKC
jgi:hypothetical protein